MGLFLFLALPAGTTYQLKDYGFGSGGAADSQSAAYTLNGITGQAGSGQAGGVAYSIGSGLVFGNQADAPPIPLLSNPGSFYNKLSLVLDPGSNPSDTRFAIAISGDGFATTEYVQSDATIGPDIGDSNYQIYAAWGGADGMLIVGLSSGTSYQVKAKAMQGGSTETAYGPTATAATLEPTLTFDIDVSPTDAKTSPPYVVDFGTLSAGTVTNSSERVWVDFSTNAEHGGHVYVAGANGGLRSASMNYRIPAINGDMTAFSQGFGAQGSTATQSAGGPFAISPAYDSTGTVVGVVDSTLREIFSAGAPTSGGRGSFVLKAKASSLTPAATDYQEILTVIASSDY